ncbi:30S ribosomal protein S20 [Desulfurispirillum indicum]|uniref:Small ribosomal subunit protein bS20 n=1 Tax=Desulfurispirillum indicum (strain ATCC BAA-1389 / DSM 22839 / S5) TaxID=653733 RepID=E6W0F7_DESIS|nr:30S ribosomal protein S20 [Desulfurispirillum indicum]ADU66375.1 ribosomal protein S20 [Desulfurispirillum indicum S5]UCZ55708.1 30S ribosomal protein S20 [Desulfurispirillum indicum]
MAHTSSARKRIRQSQKKHARNSYVKTTLRTFNKKFNKAVEAGDKEQVQTLFRQCQKKFSQAAAKGVIHKNTASRKVSRLAQAAKKVLVES